MSIVKKSFGVCSNGEEASLFTQDIWNMYKNYCSRKDWRWSELSVSHTASGG